MIDDSDVMSIIVDPNNPDNVHATACSGIYHSVNGAQTWTKYQGIPFVFLAGRSWIRQDPSNAADFVRGHDQRIVEDHQRKRFLSGASPRAIGSSTPSLSMRRIAGQRLILGTGTRRRADHRKMAGPPSPQPT